MRNTKYECNIKYCLPCYITYCTDKTIRLALTKHKTNCYIFYISATPRIDYYWREFHGIIPRDAVPAGNDRFGNPLYIGQGFVKNHGLIPGIIYPNRTFIVVPHTGPNKVERFIKVKPQHKN